MLLFASPPEAAEQTAETCTSHPPAVIELEIHNCRPAALAIEEEIAGTRLWWLRPYLESVANGNPGVVVAGRVRRVRVLTSMESVAPWESLGQTGDFFFTSSDPNFCSTFEGMESILLLREEPCCEIIPPASVACVLGLFEVRSLRPRLRALAGSGSDEDETDAMAADPSVLRRKSSAISSVPFRPWLRCTSSEYARCFFFVGAPCQERE